MTLPSMTPQLKRIAANLKLSRGPCFICGHPIDYTLPWDDEMAFTVEHVQARSTHRHLENDPSNCVPAHARCNKARGNRDYTPSMGESSEEW